MRCAVLLICAGIVGATFVADVLFAQILCLIFIATLLFSFMLAELLKLATFFAN